MTEDVNSSDCSSGSTLKSVDVSKYPRSFTEVATIPIQEQVDFDFISRLTDSLTLIDEIPDDDKKDLWKWILNSVENTAKRLEGLRLVIESDDVFHDARIRLFDNVGEVAHCGVSTQKITIEIDSTYDLHNLCQDLEDEVKVPTVVERCFTTSTKLKGSENLAITRRSSDLAELQAKTDRMLEMLRGLVSSTAESQQSESVSKALLSGAAKLKIKHRLKPGKLVLSVNEDDVEFDDKDVVTPLLRLILEETDNLEGEVGVFEIFEDFFKTKYYTKTELDRLGGAGCDESRTQTKLKKKLYDLIARINRKIRENTTLKDNLIVDAGGGTYSMNPILR